MHVIEAKGQMRSSIQNRVYPENAFTISVTGTFLVVKVADRDRRSCCACLARKKTNEQNDKTNHMT